MSDTLQQLIKEQIEAKNQPMVEALLHSIVPLLPVDQKATMGGILMYDILQDEDPAMIALFSQHFELTDAMAAGYFLDRSMFRRKDRDAMPVALNTLSESFGNVFISAIIKGDLDMVRVLQAEHPNRHIELSFSTVDGRLLADGQEVKHQFEAMQNIGGVPQFRELMETLLQIVQDNKLDQDKFLYWMCAKVHLNEADELTAIQPFTGNLPSIRSGQIDHPELLLAFIEAQDSTLMNAMHSRLFCWVKTEETSEMPTGVAYAPVKRATCYTESFDIGILSTPAAFTEPLQFTKNNDDRKALPIMDQWPCVDLGIEVVGDELSKTTIYDDKIRQKTLLDSQFIGLNHPTGYTLMSVDIDVLKSFDLGRVDHEALAHAREYAQGFYSSELLCARYQVDSNKTASFRKELKGESVADLFNFAAKSTDREAIFDSFEHTFWKNIFHAFSVVIGAPGIVEAKERFGWTNADGRHGFRLDENTIPQLFNAGYVFAQDGLGVKTSYGTSTTSECAVLNRQVISMGGWPSTDPRPTDVEDALKMGIRKKGQSLYSIYLNVHGADAAIRACKTTAQHEYILRIFTQDEIRPFAHKLPLKQLGDVFSRDIGL
ncbi:hypothetical protein [Pseudomonas serbica]|uniref:hypothetical protein n=1 Tax=Pseudomonas serbica TaxID=2965074 RepID=UPI00237ADEBE|nr:hypothetical protein [Pseudomonas serbica]